MNPELFSKLHERDLVHTEPKKDTLPPELIEPIDALVNPMIEEKEAGYHNDLVPFKQKAGQVRLLAYETMLNELRQMENAQELIKEAFREEEGKNPEEYTDSSYTFWETSLQEIDKLLSPDLQIPTDEAAPSSLQEMISLPWPFMDRVYRLANRVYEEDRFQDALDLYLFLRVLNAAVFEYWVGEATSLQALEKYLEAIQGYGFSLFLQPENPIPFYQMAICLLYINEQESAKIALETCIKYAMEQKPNYDALLEDALTVKETM